VDVPGSRRYFRLFLFLYAVQGLIVGLHFGYGVAALAPVQPVTASIMPPLAFLAFRGLTATKPSRPWIHAWAPFSVALAMAFLGILVDPLLLVIFLVYGSALWRLTRTGGDEVMAEASLQRMRPALRAARLTAALMFFFAISDAALAIYTNIAGAGHVPLAVTIMSVVVLLATGAYCLAPQAPPGPPQERQAPLSNPEDEALVARATAALEEGGLYSDENLSLARIARKAAVPARDLSAAINRATGLNVSQFVNNRRIAEACRLLNETERSATAIMLDVGFSTKSNFNREFRRVTGMSPRQWRARSKGRAIPNDDGLELRSATQQL
jgi:AraC-like DNA-binding protein